MKNISMTIAAILMATNVFAQNRVDQISKANPDATAYEVLKTAFDESRDEFKLSDVTELGINCTSVANDTENLFIDQEMHLVTVRKLISHDVAATPPKGPLFPTQPALPRVYLEKTFPFPKQIYNTNETDRLYNFVNVDIKPTEIQTENVEGRVDEQGNKVTTRFAYRKNQSLLSYAILIVTSKNDVISDVQGIAYGYCWGAKK